MMSAETICSITDVGAIICLGLLFVFSIMDEYYGSPTTANMMFGANSCMCVIVLLKSYAYVLLDRNIVLYVGCSIVCIICCIRWAVTASLRRKWDLLEYKPYDEIKEEENNKNNEDNNDDQNR